MRTLYIKYATWKTIVQNGSFTIYEINVGTDQYQAWVGARDVVYRTDVRASDFTDYNSTFPTRTAVEDEDEALANIIGLAVVLDPRAVDGTPYSAARNLVLGQKTMLRVDDGSAAMHINGLAAGSAVVIWNGGGAGDTGADWTPSAQGSETAESMHSGTNGWDTGVTAAGNFTKFDGGDNQTIAGVYDELSFWMQPKAYPPGSNLQIRWKTSGGGNAGGAELNVADYVVNFDLDVWQKVTIPIADFGLTADVDKIQFQFASQGGQQFWFDDIELNTSAGGGPFTFRLAAPDALARYHVSMIVVVLAAPDIGWDTSAFADIAGGIANGLLLRHRRISTGSTIWSINSKDNVDLFGRFHPQESVTFADGTLQCGFMIKPGLASVVITDDDVLEFIVRDDLSTLTGARAFVHYGVEDVS